MKELSMEEKAKAYDEALEKAKQIIVDYDYDEHNNVFMEIFPELRENESERIRKEIIYHIQNCDDTIDEQTEKRMVAWLEKQGKQKLPIEKLPSEMKTIGESLGFTTQKECNEYNQMVLDLIMSDGNEIKPKFKVGDTIRLKNSTAEYTIESISGGCYHGRGWGLNIIDADKSGDYVLVEQKPANKVEPKFRGGDWVVSSNGVYWHIDAIQNGRYEVTAYTGQCGNWPLDTNIYRLWTIQDAKDGDVLTNGDFPCIFKRCDDNGSLYVYCGINAYNDFSILSEDSENVWDDYPKQYFPATKEQRDLLFQKMKESRYEWDAEKKELKKCTPIFTVGDTIIKKPVSDINFGYFTITDITGGKYWYNDRIICEISEQNDWELVKQKPAERESEDNERMLDYALDMIEWYRGKYENKSRLVSDWLKSLKQRATWKPSDAQMQALKEACDKHWEPDGLDPLYTLYQQLKKLREE